MKQLLSFSFIFLKLFALSCFSLMNMSFVFTQPLVIQNPCHESVVKTDPNKNCEVCISAYEIWNNDCVSVDDKLTTNESSETFELFVFVLPVLESKILSLSVEPPPSSKLMIYDYSLLGQKVLLRL